MTKTGKMPRPFRAQQKFNDQTCPECGGRMIFKYQGFTCIECGLIGEKP